ncbi:hypothetical protein [Ramlibacter humi]|uniref:hypothetical protein n=1 Tax=Ramlibacter humi TaxID=2530451 RepID=UPI001431BD21|nr:hypothetical protein [Ramlibacter humi]
MSRAVHVDSRVLRVMRERALGRAVLLALVLRLGGLLLCAAVVLLIVVGALRVAS